MVFASNMLYSQYYEPAKKEECKHYENVDWDAKTSITFYGDSRGDLVSFPWYGEALEGWIPYFNEGFSASWYIQNLALIRQ